MFIPQSVNPLEEHAGEKENIGRARKRNFVLFGDTISWKFAFYGQIHDDTLAGFWIMYTVDRSCLPIRETDYSNGTMAPVILEFPGRVIEISYRHFSLEPTMIDTFLADCRIFQPVSKLRFVVNYSLGWLDGIGGPPLNKIGEQRYLSSTSNPRFTVEWL